MTNSSILTLDKVTMRFGGITAVKDLSIDIPKGAIVGLIGPNGAGKTTVFNVITGFYKATEGHVLFDGRDITGVPPHLVCRAGISRTFQNIRLFSTETVLQNVMVGCHVRRSAKWWMAPIGLPSFTREEKAIRERSMELLASLRLDSVADEVSSSLPYGAQRRLEIARALATRPKFLLLDEPAAGMNPQETQELMGFIREIRDRFDVTILLIEHDMKVVMGVCEYIWVLDYGEKIAEGSPEVIQSDRRVIAAYLGEEFVHHAEN
ncbi:MAG TPA: high-affinity branched-chain amino acid ABC transporter ATP-binding protein LivG [Synergistaceae bacterium]|nr:high-affinity branched-chain amino acid ABC transporter ATP-binding protein LivG [Synergistaceae bacterium]